MLFLPILLQPIGHPFSSPPFHLRKRKTTCHSTHYRPGCTPEDAFFWRRSTWPARLAPFSSRPSSIPPACADETRLLLPLRRLPRRCRGWFRAWLTLKRAACPALQVADS